MKQICSYIRTLLSLALFAFIALSWSSGDLKKSDEEPEKTDTTSDSENLIESKWFPEGLAPVMIDGKWGFIDKTGKITINPQFDRAESFSEGLARVRLGDWKTGKWGFIDKTGQFVISPQFDEASSFYEGLASVEIAK
ncbi:MAG TPA: WG repeat-containing protein, partial [Firmicutes bacterium]|nr:WG repeat-containing protein [Bacillota bacterium]